MSDLATLGIAVDSRQVKSAAKELENLSNAAKKTEGSVNRIGASSAKNANDVKAATDKMVAQFNKTGHSHHKMADGIVGDYMKMDMAAQMFQHTLLLMGSTYVLKGIFDAGIAIERIERGLKAATGSSALAAEELKYVRSESQRLGLNLESTAKAFTSLSASAKGTSLAGQGVRDIFTAVSEASTVLGLSADDTQGAIRALGQMMSKGNVQAEELRGQLGERIPGAFQIAARSMGKTTAELNGMLQRGEVLASDMLPKFAAELQKTFAGALPEAVDSAQAKLNRFQTSIFDLKVEVGESGFMDIAVNEINSLSESIGGLNDMIKDMRDLLNDLPGFDKKYAKPISTNLINSLFGGMPVAEYLKMRKKQRDLEERPNQAGLRLPMPLVPAPVVDEKAAETIKKVIDSLRFEEQQLKRTSTEQAIFNNLRAAGVTLASAEGQEIARLTRIIEGNKTATEEAKKAKEAENRHLEQTIKNIKESVELREREAKAQKDALQSLLDNIDPASAKIREYAEGVAILEKAFSGEQLNTKLIQLSDYIFGTSEAAETASKEYAEAIKNIEKSITELGSSDTSALMVFGDPLADGIGKSVTALDRLNLAYSNQATELEKILAIRKQIEETEKDPAKKAILLSNLSKKETEINKTAVQQQIGGYRELFATTKQMFSEQTKGRKALHNLEMAFAAAEIAMKMKEAVVSAVVAITNQGKGDPYTAFARVAAMGAAMAGLLASAGIAFSGGGSGNSSSPAPGSGSILGDSSKVSESADKGYALLQDIHASEYKELRGIHESMRELNAGIKGIVSGIVRNYGNFTAGNYGFSEFEIKTGEAMKNSTLFNNLTMLKPWQAIEDAAEATIKGTGALLKGDFKGLLKSTGMDGGIGGFLGKSKKLKGSGIQFDAANLADILAGGSIVGSTFADIETKKYNWVGKKKVKRSTVLGELDSGVEMMMTNVLRGLSETMLELSSGLGADAVEKIKAYTVSIGRIDLKDKTGEEISKIISGVISATGDKMTGDIFGEIVNQYQKIDEGLLETAVRLMTEKAVILDAIGKTGNAITGDAIAISQAMVELAGGLKEFQGYFETFYDKFFTNAEKQKHLTEGLNSAFASMNMILPQSREGYRKLVEALNLNNEADQSRYVTLIELAERADEYYKIIEDGQKTALKNLQAEVDKLLNGLGESVKTLESLNKSVDQTLKAMFGTEEFAHKNRTQAQSFIASAIGGFRSTGKPGDVAAIQEALSVIAKPSQDLFATFEDYQRDFFRSVNLVKELGSLTADTLTAEEKMLNLLTEQKAVDGLQHSEAMAKLESIRSAILGANLALPGYASGGYHAGGLRIVGENGPELERTGPARIYSNSETAAMFDNSELIAEVKRLREEVEAGNYAIAKNTRDVAKMLDKWDNDGLPESPDAETVTVIAV